MYYSRILSVLSIYYWLVRVFNSSDDALLVRAKRQKILRKTWISRLDLYLVTSAMELFLRKQLTVYTAIIRSSWWCSAKKVFLQILQNSQENTCAGASFLIKKRDSHTDVFLWILQNFIFKGPKKLSISTKKCHCRCSTRF